MNRKEFASKVSADGRERVYSVRWPGSAAASKAWADAFFTDHTDAFRYYEERVKGLDADEGRRRRVHTPMHSHESAGVWVVCIEPDGEIA